LAKPVSPTFRVMGWLLATGIFFAALAFWYHPNGLSDIPESTVPMVGIEQGSSQCAYPASIETPVPPLYPLIGAGIMATTGLGTSIIPDYHFVGSACTRAAVPRTASDSDLPLVLLGAACWPLLLGGFVALMGVAGKGRSRWELLGLCLVAAIPALASTVIRYLHPEDMLAMGLILLACAAAIRSRWLAAGVCIGLACCAKQFAILPAVPLLIAAPRRMRLRFVIGAVATAGVILIPSAVLMGHGMLVALRGAYATPANTGTLVGRLRLHGTILVLVARVLPLVAAGVISLWAHSRLRSAICQPEPLVGLVAVSLVMRLVFEVNLYAYYFLGTAVALIALDVIVGRIRLETLCWIVVATAFFPPQFDPLVLVGNAHPLLVQAIVVLPGVALVGLPVYRMCRAVPKVHRRDDYRLRGAMVVGGE